MIIIIIIIIIIIQQTSVYFSGDKETYGKTIEWKIAHRKKIAKSYFRITPVKLDMHDDESKNRIFIDEDFNLHIKKASIRRYYAPHLKF